MNNIFKPVVPLLLVAGLALTGCSSTAAPAEKSETTVDVPADANGSSETFVDGVLTTKDLIITITDYKVIPVGETGNEYGEKPVLAIWYDTTNLGGSDLGVTPLDFVSIFQAYQDNDPNSENKLNVGMSPDSSFNDSQLEEIKVNGTVANAVAFELDDTTTPVDLVAGAMYGGEPIGTMTINLN